MRSPLNRSKLSSCLLATLIPLAGVAPAVASTMEKATVEKPSVIYKDPLQLRLHRLQKFLPEPDRKGTEWPAFVDAMQAAGPENIPAVFITADGQVMDGGWRWRAAKELDWQDIKCEILPEDRAGVLIVETLLHRKQMTRGAAVYLALRFQDEFVRSAETRRLANLKAGRKTREIQLKAQYSSNLSTRPTDLIERWGISWETYNRARQVHELFLKRPELRKDLEPALLSGEKNLWNILSAVGGAETDQANRGLGILMQAFIGFRSQSELWKKLNDKQRADLKQQWTADAEQLPVSMRKAMKEIL